MTKKNPKVDGYLRKNKAWEPELSELRRIILECDLVEDIKWRTPCYTAEGKNILFIGAFKEYALLSFIKGVLLKDKKKLLIQQTENMQGPRVIKFKDLAHIKKLEPTLKAYIHEAVANEKAGLKIPYKTTEDFKVPEEFQAALDNSTPLQEAFNDLTPGRQRGYLLYFAGAKQSKTRSARVEKYIPHILNGKGIDDE